MLKWILLFTLILSLAAKAKTVEQEVFVKKENVTKEITSMDLLTLNGMRLQVTTELEANKLDSKLFWDKLEQKKISTIDELNFLKTVFSDVSVAELVVGTKLERPEAPAPTPDEVIRGNFKAELDNKKLKSLYEQVVSNLEETKAKTFYILADIGLGASMSLEDLGVTKAENFNGVIIDSWKKLAQKEFKNFEAVTALEKDFLTRPDYMNTKSVTLKWTSTFKKTLVDEQKKTAFYELSAQYVLVNTKSGSVLVSFDFPVQKRELSTQNKKALSSSLASLVYNLLYSQSQKILEAVQTQDAQGSAERTQLELKVVKASLSDVYALNSLIQEKLKDLKASATLKSYSTSTDSLIHLEASGSVEQIFDKLALEGGKFPLNEQKVLLFNAASKSFAIIPKDSNN